MVPNRYNSHELASPVGHAVEMVEVEPRAPTGKTVVEYDRRNLALYAALLDAHDAAVDWRTVAVELMKLDLGSPVAEQCWRSHLDRALWIVGEGMAAALIAFGERKLPEHR